LKFDSQKESCFEYKLRRVENYKLCNESWKKMHFKGTPQGQHWKNCKLPMKN